MDELQSVLERQAIGLDHRARRARAVRGLRLLASLAAPPVFQAGGSFRERMCRVRGTSVSAMPALPARCRTTGRCRCSNGSTHGRLRGPKRCSRRANCHRTVPPKRRRGQVPRAIDADLVTMARSRGSESRYTRSLIRSGSGACGTAGEALRRDQSALRILPQPGTRQRRCRSRRHRRIFHTWDIHGPASVPRSLPDCSRLYSPGNGGR